MKYLYTFRTVIVILKRKQYIKNTTNKRYNKIGYKRHNHKAKEMKLHGRYFYYLCSLEKKLKNKNMS